MEIRLTMVTRIQGMMNTQNQFTLSTQNRIIPDTPHIQTQVPGYFETLTAESWSGTMGSMGGSPNGAIQTASLEEKGFEQAGELKMVSL